MRAHAVVPANAATHNPRRSCAENESELNGPRVCGDDLVRVNDRVNKTVDGHNHHDQSKG